MNAPAFTPTARRKLGLRVEDFLALHERGAFAGHGGKIELIDGDIYVMSPPYSRHARAHTRLLVLLAARLSQIGSHLEALVEVSVQVADDSMPEPDITVTGYRGEGPVPPASVALIVEVADGTLDVDLGRKSDLYAAAGVPEYWVVDLNEQRILMHEHPSPDGYLGQLDMLLGEPARSATIEDLEIVTTTLRDPT